MMNPLHGITVIGVGRFSPFPKVNGEGILPVIERRQLFLLANYNNPTKRECNAFHRGEFHYGLHVVDDIPFITVKFLDPQRQEVITSDMYLNFVKELQGTELQGFLTSDANLLTMLLIDSRTNVIKAMRNVYMATEFIQRIRDTIVPQMKRYEASVDPDVTAEAFTSGRTTEDIWQLSTKYYIR